MDGIKKIITIGIVLFWICYPANAQYITTNAEVGKKEKLPEKSIADIDNDQIMDSLYYDSQSDSIMFSLSTLCSKPFGLKNEIKEDVTKFIAITGGFCVHNRDKQSSEVKYFSYDTEVKKFRLTSLQKRSEDGQEFTEYSLDLTKSQYEASFSRYNTEADSCVVYDDIYMPIDNDPIYWGDLEKLHLPKDDFFNEYLNNISSTCQSDTIVFVGVDKDYDIYFTIGININGDYYSDPLCSYIGIYKGDTVVLHYEMCCSQEPGDGDIFYARYCSTDMDKIGEGKLSKFYKFNKKEIVYLDFEEDEDTKLAIDYFLANTKEQLVADYLKSSGQLSIHLLDLNEKLTKYKDEGDLLVEVKNIDAGKEKFVCKFIIDTTLLRYGVTTYYVWDSEANQYKEWLSLDDEKYYNRQSE